MSEPFYEVEIETYCYFKNGQVTLTLRNPQPQKGLLVCGKPVFCNNQEQCKAKENPKCFLHCERIECRRK